MVLMRDNVFTKCINALQQVNIALLESFVTLKNHHRHRDQVTAREGKPILIIEEGDTETAAWAQHSLEVGDQSQQD